MPHQTHEHLHEHGPGCGHARVEHDDHTDYLHDGHRHRAHDDHWDECEGEVGPGDVGPAAEPGNQH